MWQGGDFPLELYWIKFGGERKNEERERERKEKKEGEKMSKKLHLLSRIYGDRATGFHRSKRQSSSTRRELRVDTRIWGFCQTLRGRVFLLLWLVLV